MIVMTHGCVVPEHYLGKERELPTWSFVVVAMLPPEGYLDIQM